MNLAGSSFLPALISVSAGLWMVRAGVAKRMLAWRKIDRDRRTRR